MANIKKKAKASKINGKKGGRPISKITSKPHSNESERNGDATCYYCRQLFYYCDLEAHKDECAFLMVMNL